MTIRPIARTARMGWTGLTRLMSPSAGVLRRPALVLGDQLIGDIVEVVADDLRLRADAQDIVAGTLDQRPLPACGDGAERIPGMAGDQAELRGFCPKLSLDIAIGLARRLVMLDAIRAE